MMDVNTIQWMAGRIRAMNNGRAGVLATGLSGKLLRPLPKKQREKIVLTPCQARSIFDFLQLNRIICQTRTYMTMSDQELLKHTRLFTLMYYEVVPRSDEFIACLIKAKLLNVSVHSLYTINSRGRAMWVNRGVTY